MNSNVEIKKLKDNIENWKAAIKITRNPVQAALLNDKIMEARNRINELETLLPKKEVKDQIDAPVIADRVKKDNSSISRVEGKSNTYKMTI